MYKDHILYHSPKAPATKQRVLFLQTTRTICHQTIPSSVTSASLRKNKMSNKAYQGKHAFVI
ncbi:hypothetical protein OKW96_05485 [Sphingobacterium sp. KU25419]|nr:hypothetical protein OKW96_05485 [Sphingobacterium sp. KU25419]